MIKIEVDALFEVRDAREAMAILGEYFVELASAREQASIDQPFEGKVKMAVNYDLELRDEFSGVYEEAKADGKNEFEWRGMPFDIIYAKYLLEYLDSRGGLTQ